MKKYNMLIFCVCLMVFQFLSADGEGINDPVGKAKSQFEFDRLAGKDGPIYNLKGFDIPSLLKALNVEVVGETERFVPGLGVMLSWTLKSQNASSQATTTMAAQSSPSGRQKICMYIGASPRNVHEMLFAELGENVRNMPNEAYLACLEKNNSVGDFCIITKANWQSPTIRFARGNVAISMQMGSGAERDTIIRLAEKIDAEIKELPPLSEKEMAALAKPTIKKKNFDPIRKGQKVDMPLMLDLPLADNQIVIVQSDDGTGGIYDPAKQHAFCAPMLPGWRLVGVGTYDKDSRLTRWDTATVEVKDGGRGE